MDVVETHISWVFLTDRYAYKLKKPVKFEFVDFSTLAHRRRGCEDELRLNRRLAHGVYLDVLPITYDASSGLSIAGRGEVVDWIVKMRRLPAAKALDVILRRGRLEFDAATAIARHLSKFYAALKPAEVTADSFRQAFDGHIRANRAALIDSLPSDKVRIARIVGAQLQHLQIEADQFKHRVEAGRVVDGHGDLRPEHIYLTSPVAVIDCVEFSSDLRTVDIADELNFLAMECQRLGDGNLGELVLGVYQQCCGDQVAAALQAFYRSYRACVRGKVAALRAAQLPLERRPPQIRLARQYLDWADHYAAEFARPVLILMGGLMGTGKSSLARPIADSLGAELISTDQVRQTLLGASESPAEYAQGHYQPALRDRVYDEMLRRAEERLCEGRSVVLDATFASRQHRDRAYGLARRHGVAVLFALCRCPRELALTRIQQRRQAGVSDSEARPDLFDRQSSDFQLPDEAEPTVVIDTTQEMAFQERQICQRLQRITAL